MLVDAAAIIDARYYWLRLMMMLLRAHAVADWFRQICERCCHAAQYAYAIQPPAQCRFAGLRQFTRAIRRYACHTPGAMRFRYACLIRHALMRAGDYALLRVSMPAVFCRRHTIDDTRL